ncbi:transporter substrate-binding domain-containing protein [Granulosicoccus sp. 3-233]|uniref:amino acid ABC transporter substrate-binding protein n=1 Tax=Granulosicoccus sp. 3-233 TaxID=3417969 RepID=UPI003D341AB7
MARSVHNTQATRLPTGGERPRAWVRVLLFFSILLSCLNAVVAASEIPYLPEKTITVGVQADASPFSYLSAAQTDEEMMPGYTGYMIEICRRVLSQMVSSGPFAGYTVDYRRITPGDRLADLDTGRIDMLCGPDSITLGRLYKYNTSHPLFLSGISYATVDNESFPRGRYCSAVLGLVGGTTAETEGLRKLDESNALQRYDAALERFLALYANREIARTPSLLLARIKELKENMQSGFATLADEARGKDRIDPSLIRTENCPNGFSRGPVVFYDSHQQGIEDLCKARILFYVSDVDILSGRVKGCNVILQRETMTREAYGVFFRRSAKRLNDADDSGGGKDFPDSALYAEFNNVLLRKMQTTENILDYEFSRQFKGEKPTMDLQNFFDGYKFVVDF